MLREHHIYKVWSRECHGMRDQKPLKSHLTLHRPGHSYPRPWTGHDVPRVAEYCKNDKWGIHDENESCIKLTTWLQMHGTLFSPGISQLQIGVKCLYNFLLALDHHPYVWIDVSLFTGSISKEDTKISHCGWRPPKYVDWFYRHFTLLFCRGRQRNVPRFKMHMHGHCFAH